MRRRAGGGGNEQRLIGQNSTGGFVMDSPCPNSPIPPSSLSTPAATPAAHPVYPDLIPSNGIPDCAPYQWWAAHNTPKSGLQRSIIASSRSLEITYFFPRSRGAPRGRAIDNYYPSRGNSLSSAPRLRAGPRVPRDDD